ncbi:hypothetical protein BDA96_10G099100 [Sorghum bicolor]|nr:hypothetical protein BDA96_10G099100 [Sorghum bicolor]
MVDLMSLRADPVAAMADSTRYVLLLLLDLRARLLVTSSPTPTSGSGDGMESSSGSGDGHGRSGELWQVGEKPCGRFTDAMGLTDDRISCSILGGEQCSTLAASRAQWHDWPPASVHRSTHKRSKRGHGDTVYAARREDISLGLV